MADPNEGAGEYHEQLRPHIDRRWRSWGEDPEEVIEYTAGEVKEILGLEDEPTEEQVLRLAAATSGLLNPSRRMVDSMRDARADGESA